MDKEQEREALSQALKRAVPILAKAGLKDDEAWSVFSQAVSVLAATDAVFAATFRGENPNYFPPTPGD